MRGKHFCFKENEMKKIISFILAAMMLFALCACGAENAAPAENETDAEQSGNNIGNPVEDATVESLLTDMGIDFSAFSQFEDAAFSKINGTVVIGQVNYTFGGDKYNARIAPLPTEQSIDGMNYAWSETSEAAVGYCTAKVCLTAEGQGIISWFDVVPGIMYSISMSENATAEKLTDMANKMFVPVQGEVNGDFEPSFDALLDEMVANYRPGTAGSGINANTVAAQIADLFASMAPSADEVTAAVKAYVGALSDDAKADFPERVSGIAAAYGSLVANGIEALADGGYEAVSYPWPESVSACFDAMAAAVK